MASPSNIKLLVLDVDGVLTDGALIYDDNGVETKRFHVRDGFGIRAAMQMGIKVGVVTARSSRVVSLRLAELGVDLYVHGMDNKAIGLEMVTQQAGVEFEETAYLGDDILDLPAMVRCGYPMAVADAAEEVRDVAKFVTTAPGGRGAVREAAEHLLRAQGHWDAVLERFGE
jgi:3-deoxy-D-manno-octulosonate 8-phosphate phosphatase (KDO 8-P phosphatase)